jgi:DnaJ family protein C protein 28
MPSQSADGQNSAPQPEQSATPQPSAAQPAPKPARRHWSDVVEEILAASMARGEFDNLRGKGRPLRLDDDIYAGDKALAYRLLKNNDAAPPEIERGREIDAELARAEGLLETLRRRRDALLGRGTRDLSRRARTDVGGSSAAERRMYNLVRDKTEAQYREALRAVNSKVLSLNIVAPAALHRPSVPVEAKMQAFAEEFPRLEE